MSLMSTWRQHMDNCAPDFLFAVCSAGALQASRPAKRNDSTNATSHPRKTPRLVVLVSEDPKNSGYWPVLKDVRNPQERRVSCRKNAPVYCKSHNIHHRKRDPLLYEPVICRSLKCEICCKLELSEDVLFDEHPKGTTSVVRTIPVTPPLKIRLNHQKNPKTWTCSTCFICILPW